VLGKVIQRHTGGGSQVDEFAGIFDNPGELADLARGTAGPIE
jgi:hypothetical protein